MTKKQNVNNESNENNLIQTRLFKREIKLIINNKYNNKCYLTQNF